VYFTNPKAVCNKKSIKELICADGLGGNDEDAVHIIKKDLEQISLFLNIHDAEVFKKDFT